MPNISDYLANKVTDHIHGKAAFTMPQVFIGLSTTLPTAAGGNITEPTIGTGGYARIATTAASWAVSGAVSPGLGSSAVTLSFPASTAAWSTGATALLYSIYFDAATAGNMLAWSVLPTPRTVNAADITLTAAAGAISHTTS
jgi:hypothetical protein